MSKKTENDRDVFKMSQLRVGNFRAFYQNIPISQDSNTRFPSKHYVFKVNYRNTRKRREIFSKLILKTTERRQCC